MEDAIIAGQAIVWGACINTVISFVFATVIGLAKQVILIYIHQKDLVLCLESALQNARVVEIPLEKLNSDRAADN